MKLCVHPDDVLTTRQWSVLKLMMQGLSNKEIAVRLVIAEKTVETHVHNILTKLHVKTRVQAALWAAQQTRCTSY